MKTSLGDVVFAVGFPSSASMVNAFVEGSHAIGFPSSASTVNEIPVIEAPSNGSPSSGRNYPIAAVLPAVRCL